MEERRYRDIPWRRYSRHLSQVALERYRVKKGLYQNKKGHRTSEGTKEI